MQRFLPGLVLSERFFSEAIRPLLDASFLGLAYAAGLIGAGSDVMGFDTAMSMDHDWGPRLQLFIAQDSRIEEIDQALSEALPREFAGFPTIDASTGHHRVEITTPEGFFHDYLNFDLRQRIEPADWLTFPEQKLRTIASGKLFHDSVDLAETRMRFSYYPDDVWRYQLASVWERIGQEEHLIGRAGIVGDELGATVIAARVVRDLMRLALLMECVYAPYPKWFGSAFRQLKCSKELGPLLEAILRAQDWKDRDDHLAKAYEFVARMHNSLRLTQPRPEIAEPFFDRPFRVIHLHGQQAEALRKTIVDPTVREIAARRKIGGIDIFSDSTDLVSHAVWRPKLRRLYEED